jgi:tetratricopeptide (TPR) repeat protein
MRHKTEPPPDPREINPRVPVELARIILKCLEKERENRYASAEELHAELEELEERLTPEGEIGPPVARKGKAGLLTRKVLVAAAVAAAVVLVLLSAWRIRRALIPKSRYEQFILVDLFTDAPKGINKDLLEYAILRSLTASTKLSILSRRDFAVYKKNIAPKGEKEIEPVLAVTARAAPKVAGFEVTVTVKHEGKTRRKTFDCKGASDLLSGRLPQILDFIAGRSGGLVTGIEGGRTFAQISTGNMDALGYFLKGEAAWGKLDSEAAYIEYRAAIDYDFQFALACLQLADVQVFRGDMEDASAKLQDALKGKDRLISYDLIRLRALMARIGSRPAEERQYLQQLTEAFSFKKEYHYELAESYFHTGDADEAIRHYTKALELDPDYSLAHNHIAYAYAWVGDHARAEEHFKKYLDLDHTANSYDSLAAGYMFAGRYDDALEALGKGIELSPGLDYLYRNMACNYILKGALAKAGEYLSRQMKITRMDDTVVDAKFYMAYIDLLKGSTDRAARELIPVREYYEDGRFAGRLDDYPNLPFWLTGVIAYRKGDAKTLGAMIKLMEKKISSGGVTATNYFPIYKLYIHLKILEGGLEGNADKVLSGVAEGQRIKRKMGYWDSIFNLSFFFDAYAAVLIRMGKTPEALALLEEAVAYNPGFASTRVNLAKIYLEGRETEKARGEVQAAQELLRDADKDFALLNELNKIKAGLPDSSAGP